MRTSGLFLAALIAAISMASGCVSQQEFDEYKAEQEELRDQMNARMDNADVYDQALACESRMDAYQATTGSDEPIGTRRDEPIGTRRDECIDDFDDIFGPLISECRDEMVACVGILPVEDCNACYADCYVNGAWPNAQCPIP